MRTSRAGVKGVAQNGRVDQAELLESFAWVLSSWSHRARGDRIGRRRRRNWIAAPGAAREPLTRTSAFAREAHASGHWLVGSCFLRAGVTTTRGSCTRHRPARRWPRGTTFRRWMVAPLMIGMATPRSRRSPTLRECFATNTQVAFVRVGRRALNTYALRRLDEAPSHYTSAGSIRKSIL